MIDYDLCHFTKHNDQVKVMSSIVKMHLAYANTHFLLTFFNTFIYKQNYRKITVIFDIMCRFYEKYFLKSCS